MKLSIFFNVCSTRYIDCYCGLWTVCFWGAWLRLPVDGGI